MSRETDTPSSGPNGRGGPAYPSGTPPYGIPAVSDDATDAGRSAAQPEERKTETTLTTRIRINIPGSRPIPPVVVRTPVADAESKGADKGADTGAGKGADTQAQGAATSTGTVEPPAEPAAPGEEKATSDWFAPRKSSGTKGGQGGGSTNGAGLPGASAGPASGSGASTPGAGSAGGTRPGAGRPGGVVGSMSVPGATRSGGANSARTTGTGRPGGTNGAGLPGATGGPVAPGHGGGTGSFDVTEALAAGPLGSGSGNGSRSGAPGEPRRDELPYFTENERGDGRNGQGGQSGHSALSGYGGQGDLGGYGGEGGLDGFEEPGESGGFGGQGGPGGFSGHGEPDGFDAQGGPGGFNGQGEPGGFGGQGGPGSFNGPGGHGGPGVPGGPQGPAGPTSGPVTGDGPLPPHAAAGTGLAPGAPGIAPGGPGSAPGGPRTARPGGGLSDDTAILTPQKPAPEPGTPGFTARPDNVSGHTVTSGIPVVPSGTKSPFGPGSDSGGPGPHTPPKLPEPKAQSASAPAKKAPKKKGRSKLALLGGGVIAIAGIAYGAGLLMNHSDVPKGTTVLGVDIGGGTRDDAVKKLDDAFGSRVNKPLKLSVDGKTVTLKPDQAGLQFNTQSTASAAATSDYNPVSVIGSLFGNHRVVQPVMPVDEEKLQAALNDAGGGSGSVTEGTIKFQSGKAVPVYGKAGKAIDAAQATDAVEQAYRTEVETGTATPVQVPTTTKQPTISNAEVDRMMKEFAKPAMSASVTVKTSDGLHILTFSPEKSLWKFLGVKAQNGQLVEYYDKAALKELYGHSYDGVLITRSTGKKTAVTVEDVLRALRPALLSKTNRVGTIQLNQS